MQDEYVTCMNMLTEESLNKIKNFSQIYFLIFALIREIYRLIIHHKQLTMKRRYQQKRK